MVGGSASATVTLDAQAALTLPEPSVAAHEIGVVPNGNVKPDGGTQAVVTPGQLSAPDALKMAGAPPGPVHSTVIGAGHVTLGFSWSCTVTMAEHTSCAPLLSVTVSVTAVAPREYGEAGDWRSVI